jgi:hypothetical protein
VEGSRGHSCICPRAWISATLIQHAGHAVARMHACGEQASWSQLSTHLHLGSASMCPHASRWRQWCLTLGSQWTASHALLLVGGCLQQHRHGRFMPDVTYGLVLCFCGAPCAKCSSPKFLQMLSRPLHLCPRLLMQALPLRPSAQPPMAARASWARCRRMAWCACSVCMLAPLPRPVVMCLPDCLGAQVITGHLGCCRLG